METEDLRSLPASSTLGSGRENNNSRDSVEPGEADSLPTNSEVKDRNLKVEIHRNDSFSSAVHAENGCTIVQGESRLSNHKRDGSPISRHAVDESPISGVKRSRITVVEQQPSVHIMYNSLPRDSKQKLEELLRQWSEWHAQHCSSCQDSNEMLESGEETYFPALCVGLDKPSAVTIREDVNLKQLAGGGSLCVTSVCEGGGSLTLSNFVGHGAVCGPSSLATMEKDIKRE
ncbi:unnamed protein product [Ilex paraguariensis]|uniref:Uncharacterized protein n=1 Tax=Ilex paraguariensis TaxID=185542 RepID=A0ABC8U2W5_9AQUA